MESPYGIRAIAYRGITSEANSSIVEHADLFDQAERMMQRQHIDARAESEVPRALRHAGQEHVLGRGEAVDRRRVVLRQVIGMEPGRVESLDLEQALVVDPIEPHTRHRLDVVEDPESQTQVAFSSPTRARYESPAPARRRTTVTRPTTAVVTTIRSVDTAATVGSISVRIPSHICLGSVAA